MNNSVWVVGEALIDLVPNKDKGTIPLVGGGPANTAKALAGLGIQTNFIGGISSDKHGDQISNELLKSGVDLSLSLISDLPTATARIILDVSGSASYEFSLIDTATFAFRTSWLPKGHPAVLHFGTLGTLIEPGATHLFNWIKNVDSVKVFDPNIRPSVMSDRRKYLTSVEKWFSISDVVKMSSEDFEWLFPEIEEPSKILNYGPRLLVITRGSEGITALHRSGTVSVPSVKVEIIDTVGAGDTVGAIIVEAVLRLGLNSLLADLEPVLVRAAKAAAITCSRAGAQPPSIAELAAF